MISDEQAEGLVFNVQKFSVNDGEGIRDVVFMKGCPLRCRWCSNPESQVLKPEHAYNPQRCLTAQECGQCLKVCKTGALTLINGLIAFDVRKCAQCFACHEVCPTGAQTVYGEMKKVKDILDLVERDGVFYTNSGGGMTLSGGECMMQYDFALSLLRAAKDRRINTCIETCGYYPYEHLKEACRYLDKLIMDIKCFDPVKHKEGTGVDNKIILDNFRRVIDDYPDLPVRVRTPIIPGFNDTEEDIRAIRAFIPRRVNIEYELLPYHRMGQPKYGYLGRRYDLAGRQLDKETMKHLLEIAK